MGRYDKRGGGDQLAYGETVDGDEKPLAVSTRGELHVLDSSLNHDLLRQILVELRAINVHLLAITDERILGE